MIGTADEATGNRGPGALDPSGAVAPEEAKGKSSMHDAKVSEFVAHYRRLSDEELIDLSARRDSMVPEAVAALDNVLTERHIDKQVLSTRRQEVLEERKPKPKPRIGLIAIQLLIVAVVMGFSSTLAQLIPHWLGLLIVLGFAFYWAFRWFRSRR